MNNTSDMIRLRQGELKVIAFTIKKVMPYYDDQLFMTERDLIEKILVAGSREVIREALARKKH